MYFWQLFQTKKICRGAIGAMVTWCHSGAIFNCGAQLVIAILGMWPPLCLFYRAVDGSTASDFEKNKNMASVVVPLLHPVDAVDPVPDQGPLYLHPPQEHDTMFPDDNFRIKVLSKAADRVRDVIGFVPASGGDGIFDGR